MLKLRKLLQFFVPIFSLFAGFYILNMFGVFDPMWAYLESVFIVPLYSAYIAFTQGGDYIAVGIILVVISLLGYAIIFFMLKLIVIDTVFPKIRTIDEFKNRVIHARLI